MQCTPALRYCFCINILHTLCLAVNACYPLSFVVVVVCYPIAEEAINKSVNVMKSKGKSTEAPTMIFSLDNKIFGRVPERNKNRARL